MLESFEVLFCHDGHDAATVIELAEKIKESGIYVWLDLWEHKRTLRKNLAEYFNREELRSFCFDIGIKHENLPDTIDAMARELVIECDHKGLTPKLIENGRRLRPQLQWDHISAFTSEQLQKIFKTTRAVLVLIGRKWDPTVIKAYLSEFNGRDLSIIPVLLPSSLDMKIDLDFLPLSTKPPIVNLQQGIENGLPLLLWRITGSNVSEAMEVSKTLVEEAIESAIDIPATQEVDVWGMALLKNRLHALSEIVAQESAQEAMHAVEAYRYDALTLLVPLTVSLRWHRGYSSGLERLLDIPHPQAKLKDFQCKEVSPPCPVSEGVLSAEQTAPDQVLIKLDGNPAVVVYKLASSDMQAILSAVNQHGRLGVPETGGLSLVQRISEEVSIRPQSESLDELSAALFRNREALIPLVARWSMPASEWFLPHEENFPPIGENFLADDMLGKENQGGRKALKANDFSQDSDVVIEEDFVANRALNPSQSGKKRFSEQEIQQQLRQLFGDNMPKDPKSMLDLINRRLSRQEHIRRLQKLQKKDKDPKDL